VQTCGELLYGDFKESKPGSLDKLAAQLREHSGRGQQQGSSTSLQTPSKAHARYNNSRIGWNMPGGNGDGNPNGEPNDSESQGAAKGPSAPVSGKRQALQLCIQTGKFKLELGELDLELDQPSNDGLIFETMRKKYQNTRRSIFPMWLRFSQPDKIIFVKVCYSFPRTVNLVLPWTLTTLDLTVT
jgi:hypothetical protein